MSKLLDFISQRPSLNRKSLALEAGLPQNYVSDYFGGHRKMTDAAALKLAKALILYGLKVDELLFVESKDGEFVAVDTTTLTMKKKKLSQDDFLQII